MEDAITTINEVEASTSTPKKYRVFRKRERENSKELYERHYRALVGCQCIAAMIMIGVGGFYYNDCNLEVTLHLCVEGGLIIFLNLFPILVLKTPFQCDDECARYLVPILNIFQLVVVLWGSFDVFSHIPHWKPDLPPSHRFYCHVNPFMFALVILTLEWIFQGCIMGVWFCELYSFSKQKRNMSTNNENEQNDDVSTM